MHLDGCGASGHIFDYSAAHLIAAWRIMLSDAAAHL